MGGWVGGWMCVVLPRLTYDLPLHRPIYTYTHVNRYVLVGIMGLFVLTNKES